MECQRHSGVIVVAGLLCSLCLWEQAEQAERARHPQAPRGVIQPRPRARPVPDDTGTERHSPGPPSDRVLMVNLATSTDSLRHPIRFVTADGGRTLVYIDPGARSTSTGTDPSRGSIIDVFPLA